MHNILSDFPLRRRSQHHHLRGLHSHYLLLFLSLENIWIDPVQLWTNKIKYGEKHLLSLHDNLNQHVTMLGQLYCCFRPQQSQKIISLGAF